LTWSFLHKIFKIVSLQSEYTVCNPVSIRTDGHLKVRDGVELDIKRFHKMLRDSISTYG